MMAILHFVANGHLRCREFPKLATCWRKSIMDGGATNTGIVLNEWKTTPVLDTSLILAWSSIKPQEIVCERKWLPALSSRIESVHIPEGDQTVSLISWSLNFWVLFSVSHPFLGDYVRLRQNVQWKKMSLENNDQYVVFADIINKIARSSGKVSDNFIWLSTHLDQLF